MKNERRTAPEETRTSLAFMGREKISRSENVAFPDLITPTVVDIDGTRPVRLRRVAACPPLLVCFSGLVCTVLAIARDCLIIGTLVSGRLRLPGACVYFGRPASRVLFPFFFHQAN